MNKPRKGTETMNNPIKNRYDFVLIFDVQDGNPNGDPDAGNLPRVDPETGCGLVTDVCLKRKVRNYVQMTKNSEEDLKNQDVYVKEKAVLGRSHVEAFRSLNIQLGEETRVPVPTDIREVIAEFSLPEGLSLDEGDDGSVLLVIAADADAKAVKEAIKEAKPGKDLKGFFAQGLRGVRSRKPTGEEAEQGRDWMCRRFYDIRTFGAVMSLKSAPNCGQVRGPVQMTFGRSVEPIVTLEHSITRMAVATEAEAEKQGGDNRTMGRKNTVPYGLYVAHGFVSAHLAAQTKFGEDDLKLLWEALGSMFEHDRSAARGLMATQKLIVFKHESPLGNAPAHALFDRIKITRNDPTKPARAFSDYNVVLNRSALPPGIEIQEML
jgi:CRISPR-associated protein Csd2